MSHVDGCHGDDCSHMSGVEDMVLSDGNGHHSIDIDLLFMKILM
jgi:hypothetical protein